MVETPSRTASLTDEEARTIARDALEGRVTHRDARRVLAVAVSASQALVDVARKFGRDEQEREDLADSLRSSLVALVLDEQRGFFDLHVAAESSLTGWVRQTAVGFARRSRVLHPTEPSPVPVDPHDAPQWDDPRRAAPSAEDSALNADVEVLLAASTAALDMGERRQRVANRPWLAATAMRQVLRLPRLCVPRDPDDRRWVQEALTADEHLAARSLRTVLDLAAGFDDGFDHDERLLSLWDDHTNGQMARLLDFPDSTAHVIALGQVVLAPKPSRVAMRTMRKALRDTVGPAQEWATLTATLLGSFVARVAESVSAFDGRANELTRLAVEAEAATLAAMWPDLLERVVSWPGAPLGADEADVEQHLWAVFLDATSGAP